jgi:uncharacterized protein (TIGR02466 family)
MSSIEPLFVTSLYRERLSGAGATRLIRELPAAARAIAADDEAGQAWCEANGYRGYTSYASLDDLPWRDPVIAELVGHLDSHVAAFARALDYDLARGRLVLDSLWVNILEPGGSHASHIHPNSAISGTYYVDVPAGAGGLKLEDPRHQLMMAAPPRRPSARVGNRTHVTVTPRAGQVLLWESFVRHEVLSGAASQDRISISFNYRLP